MSALFLLEVEWSFVVWSGVVCRSIHVGAYIPTRYVGSWVFFSGQVIPFRKYTTPRWGPHGLGTLCEGLERHQYSHNLKVFLNHSKTH